METILVVDDEADTVELLASILEEVGYKVFGAYDGKEAFDLYCQHQNVIKLVLTDNIMPNDGYTLLENIRSINPQIKYILHCSWICEAEKGCEQKEQLWKPILRRPSKIENILKLVRDVLDEKVECSFAKATTIPKTETPLEAIDLEKILASGRERMEKLLGKKRMEEIEEAKKRKKEKIFEQIRRNRKIP